MNGLTLLAGLGLSGLGLGLTCAALAAGYEAGPVDKPGSIAGEVHWEGEAASENFAVERDAEVCGEQIDVPLIEVGKNGALRNAVVFIEAIDRGTRIDRLIKHPLLLEKCRFTPTVLSISAGQVLVLTNRDPHLYEIRGGLEGHEEAVITANLPIQGMKTDKRLTRPGPMRLRSITGHDWMTAWVYVLEHPYHAVTDKKGRFRIGQVPAGEYRLTAWHPTVGRQTIEIQVEKGRKVEVTFDELTAGERTAEESTSGEPVPDGTGKPPTAEPRTADPQADDPEADSRDDAALEPPDGNL